MVTVLNKNEIIEIYGGCYRCYCVKAPGRSINDEDYQWKTDDPRDENVCWRACKDEKIYINYKFYGDTHC